MAKKNDEPVTLAQLVERIADRGADNLGIAAGKARYRYSNPGGPPLEVDAYKAHKDTARQSAFLRLIDAVNNREITPRNAHGMVPVLPIGDGDFVSLAVSASEADAIEAGMFGAPLVDTQSQVEAQTIGSNATAPKRSVSQLGGVLKGVIAFRFHEVHFPQESWGRNLDDPPNWVKPHRLSSGTKGRAGTQSTWDPVGLAKAVVSRQRDPAKRSTFIAKLNKAFTNDDLSAYRAAWKEFVESMADPE